jgi:hypothetical protein
VVFCGRYQRSKNVCCVLALVRHVLDVGEEAHARVLVRVHRVGQVGQALRGLDQRVREVLEVLALDRERLGAELGIAVLEVLEPVRLEREHLVQVRRGEIRVVVRVVVRGVGVLVGARGLDARVVLLGRVLLGAAEHHVLEEVREAGLAGLHLVARARLDRDLQRHHALSAASAPRSP